MNYQPPHDTGTHADGAGAQVGAQAGDRKVDPRIDPGADPAIADADARRRRRRIVAVAIIVAVLAVAALVFWRVSAGADDPVAEPDNAPRVTVSVPGRTTITGRISATGTLAARRAIPVGVVGEGGRVVSVSAEQGDWVRQGQVLVVIDRSVQDQQARSAAAQVKVAQADAQLAQSNLDRALKLVERGFISQADIDQLTATRDAQIARVDVARAQAGELRARNDRLAIHAPVSGLILQRAVEPGQTVGTGTQPLFTIARGGEMELLAQVGETDLAQLSTGEQATVTPVGGDRSFTGQIWQIAPTIDEQTRQGTARIALSYAPQLKPGGFASAIIDSGTLVAPMLPESAILSDDDGSYVFVVGPDDTVRRRGVTTGAVTARGIAVTQGLDGTERVVLRAGGFLNAGDKVKPEIENDAP